MKLIERLYEQLAIAQCMLAGEAFEAFKEKVVKPPETGEGQTIRKRKAVRPWYYDANEHYYFEIKVGLKSMELDKGKTAIDVGPQENLLEVISTIIKAVGKGELDTHILALSLPKRQRSATEPRRLTKPTHITMRQASCFLGVPHSHEIIVT